MCIIIALMKTRPDVGYNVPMNTESLYKSLVAAAGVENVRTDEPMSAHTTFRIGGPADFFVAPVRAQDVVATIGACRQLDVPFYVVGRGSNLLVADAGLRGVVVQIAGNLSSVAMSGEGTVVADAGVTNAKVASMACRESLGGYEFAAGIPGTVGGASIMNAGAYGGEFRDVARKVVCLDADGETREVSRDEAGWGYRSSMMLDEGMVVLSVELELHEDDQAAIQLRMDELARKRTDKQPLDVPSAGSTFKRPEGHFAGKLIQDAGLQGYAVGGAEVSRKHAGFVVNVGGATADDVVRVIRHVQEVVLASYGVALEPEVRMWGF